MIMTHRLSNVGRMQTQLTVFLALISYKQRLMLSTHYKYRYTVNIFEFRKIYLICGNNLLKIETGYTNVRIRT
jgi:hypothetical protein